MARYRIKGYDVIKRRMTRTGEFIKTYSKTQLERIRIRLLRIARGRMKALHENAEKAAEQFLKALLEINRLPKGTEPAIEQEKNLWILETKLYQATGEVYRKAVYYSFLLGEHQPLNRAYLTRAMKLTTQARVPAVTQWLSAYDRLLEKPQFFREKMFVANFEANNPGFQNASENFDFARRAMARSHIEGRRVRRTIYARYSKGGFDETQLARMYVRQIARNMDTFTSVLSARQEQLRLVWAALRQQRRLHPNFTIHFAELVRQNQELVQETSIESRKWRGLLAELGGRLTE
ncbi:MAG: hypothetical protein J4215_05490 [Candidatus Diapherotrites archaeon]|uniref:Uncharacterized protein n=1 Tax=Candidatus Iainarchaeum sp. TaxID=3101447 RepID=A0A8T4L5V9_9ARCH|nr:hypothetical protein [Candidatus Diapherotrites archaeon]